SYSKDESSAARPAEATANAASNANAATGGGGGVFENTAEPIQSGNSAANMPANSNASGARLRAADEESKTADVLSPNEAEAKPAAPIDQAKVQPYSSEARRDEMTVDGASAPPPKPVDEALDRSDKK